MSALCEGCVLASHLSAGISTVESLWLLFGKETSHFFK